jgi:hypothetical protein
MKAYFRVICERVDSHRGIEVLHNDVFPLAFTFTLGNDASGWAREELSMMEWSELEEFVKEAGINPDEDDHVYEIYGLMELESYQCNSPIDQTEYDTSRELSEVSVRVLSKDEAECFLDEGKSAALSAEEVTAFNDLITKEGEG